MNIPTRDARNQSCCFTGHRIIAKDELPILEDKLKSYIEQLLHLGVVNFYCGGAIGFDMLAGFTVIEMKKKYPQIKLILVIPCRDQDAKWNHDQRVKYGQLLEAADETVCLSEKYHRDCMLIRNRYLVEHSGICLAYLTQSKSGTAQTVRIAMEQGIEVANLAVDAVPALVAFSKRRRKTT